MPASASIWKTRRSTPSASKPPAPSTSGVAAKPLTSVTESSAPDRSAADQSVTDSCYLPDFSSASAVIALVLITELVALALSVARGGTGTEFFVDLARSSLLILWMTLTSACVLTLVRPILARRSIPVATAFAIGLVVACVAVVSELVIQFGQYFSATRLVDISGVLPVTRFEFLSRNLLLSILVAGGVLRYYYVTHQWRTNVEREAESRITALQARIRPHFLFNSMNTIAALTRTDPAAAESAVEDLADLFRASLSNPGESISLEQELEVTRVYQRMEEQRLGSRLQVDWQLNDVPLQTRVPGLTIQPLLENAIYHGIEPRAEGGTITVWGVTEADMVTITVSNPLPEHSSPRSGGHQLALENIRQRLELAYGRRARFEVDSAAEYFRVLIGFPLPGAGKRVFDEGTIQGVAG
ncbi:MAG: sensor histidine kinase [Gammaproteobacteria bacterium]|nr:sensor histidine kinase [Gammaproteobacteria bacterium]